MATYITLSLIQFTDTNVDLYNLDIESLICYTDAACSQNPNDQGVPNYEFNDCCGYVVLYPYYKADDGLCSPCK